MYIYIYVLRPSPTPGFLLPGFSLTLSCRSPMLFFAWRDPGIGGGVSVLVISPPLAHVPDLLGLDQAHDPHEAGHAAQHGRGAVARFDAPEDLPRGVGGPAGRVPSYVFPSDKSTEN